MSLHHVVPDTGLMIAVDQYAGSQIHYLRNLAQQYQSYCWLNRAREAEEIRLDICRVLNRSHRRKKA